MVIPQRSSTSSAARGRLAAPASRRTALRRTGVPVAAAWVLAALAVPNAQASAGAGSDRANDATTTVAGHDILSVGLAYDRGGTLVARASLRGAPDPAAPATLKIVAGNRAGRDCTAYPFIGFATQVAAPDAIWTRDDADWADEISGPATKNGGGSADQEFKVYSSSLRALPVSCLIATTSDPENPQIVYDQTGPFALVNAKLTARVRAVPSALRPGRTRTLRVTLRNPGDAATGRISLSVAKARGMTVRVPRTVASLAAGKRRVVSLRVRLSARAKAVTRLRLTATTASALSARDQVSLRLRRRR